MPFQRNLNDKTITALNELYQKQSWWKALVDHKETFVAVRPNSELNVYAGGGSIARIGLARKYPFLRVNVKFLVDVPSGYVNLLSQNNESNLNAIIRTPEQFCENIGKIIKNAKTYHNGERLGEVIIASRCLSVIDVEVAFSEAESGDGDGEIGDDDSKSGRIDIVVLDSDGTLNFIECKLYRSSELRDTETPAVCGQLATYQQWIRENKNAIKKNYKAMVEQLARLNGKAFDRYRPGRKVNDVNESPMLLIFGYARNDESNASELAESVLKAASNYGVKGARVRCIGSAARLKDESLMKKWISAIP